MANIGVPQDRSRSAPRVKHYYSDCPRVKEAKSFYYLTSQAASVRKPCRWCDSRRWREAEEATNRYAESLFAQV